MSIQMTFDEVPHGAYFKATLDGVEMTFVNRGAYDEAYTIDPTTGLADEAQGIEFDLQKVCQMLEEHEWPEITTYKAEIESWDWDYILHKMQKSVFLDEEGEPVHREFLGTTISITKSGKIYTFWTSNQTDEDVNRDRQFNEALEEVAEEKGVYIDWVDSDCFVCKATTFEEVATAAGYELFGSGPYGWQCQRNPNDNTYGYASEEEAWEACCRDNNLIQE